ncbi:SDR family NAD(P)-dependent oxidoreductase [Arenibacter palladensis]|uniref:SDR family NAD(P)-dependent oxidoreductase n=1 Tax=Arenibacter palladensis TaxID=237373 RepID=UPI0026E3BC63|nr:SDR family NAD(P)-dependent oxidoreductase [Arenibacter palladensis]MDO6605687.1 SDR family NAD(P)-dependent oxidoreductase [Arenibacter palladensis]
MDKTELKDKVAVVTGAGGRLCSEMAYALIKKDIKIALLGRTLEKLERVQKEIEKRGGKAISVPVDVTDLVSLIEVEKRITEELGPCHILINGAGGNNFDAITSANEYSKKELETSNTEFKGFFNMGMDTFHRVVEINTMGSVIPCQVFGKTMAANGGGVIINIASMNSYRPLSRVAAYSLAKAGIDNFTKWLAAYLAPANIRVNAIAPGFFLNENSKKRLTNEDGELSQRGQNILDHTPQRKFGTPDQLIGCMNWMISDNDSGFLTGVTVPIDGGFLTCSGV